MKSHRVRKTTKRREKGWKQLQCWYLHELQSFASCERREGNYKERGCKGEGRANPRIAQTHCTHRYIEHCILHIAYCTHRHIAYCTLHIRVSQKNQKSEFCFATKPTGFHRLDEPPEKISAL